MTEMNSKIEGEKYMLENHSLAKELPEYKELIHEMKMNDGHFSRLFNEYDEVEHTVHRIESGAEAASDERLENLKKHRLSLKDEMFEMLKKAA